MGPTKITTGHTRWQGILGSSVIWFGSASRLINGSEAMGWKPFPTRSSATWKIIWTFLWGPESIFWPLILSYHRSCRNKHDGAFVESAFTNENARFLYRVLRTLISWRMSPWISKPLFQNEGEGVKIFEKITHQSITFNWLTNQSII